MLGTCWECEYGVPSWAMMKLCRITQNHRGRWAFGSEGVDMVCNPVKTMSRDGPTALQH